MVYSVLTIRTPNYPLWLKILIHEGLMLTHVRLCCACFASLILGHLFCMDACTERMHGDHARFVQRKTRHNLYGMLNIQKLSIIYSCVRLWLWYLWCHVKLCVHLFVKWRLLLLSFVYLCAAVCWLLCEIETTYSVIFQVMTCVACFA